MEERPGKGRVAGEVARRASEWSNKNVAAELLAKLLKDEIKQRGQRKVVQSRAFSEMLQKTLTAYHNRAIALALLPGGGINSFQLYVFYEEDKDIEACNRSGVTQDILDDLYKELEQAGRGSRDSITVRVEVDSHENVVAKFQGNYDRRLR